MSEVPRGTGRAGLGAKLPAASFLEQPMGCRLCKSFRASCTATPCGLRRRLLPVLSLPCPSAHLGVSPCFVILGWPGPSLGSGGSGVTPPPFPASLLSEAGILHSGRWPHLGPTSFAEPLLFAFCLGFCRIRVAASGWTPGSWWRRARKRHIGSAPAASPNPASAAQLLMLGHRHGRGLSLRPPRVLGFSHSWGLRFGFVDGLLKLAKPLGGDERERVRRLPQHSHCRATALCLLSGPLVV